MSSVKNLPLATVNVVTTSGGKIPLHVLVVEKIATPLETHNHQDVEDFPHFRGLKLAQPIKNLMRVLMSHSLLMQIITVILLKTMLSVDMDQELLPRRLASFVRTIAYILRCLFNYCCELATAWMIAFLFVHHSFAHVFDSNAVPYFPSWLVNRHWKGISLC